MTRRRDGQMSLSLPEARRLAISAQGFGARPEKPGMNHVRRIAAKVYAFQIDSVNVLARAHYVPAFARLGPYPTGALDDLAYRRAELFEYWGHAACLMPIALYPLLRHRMHTAFVLDYMKRRPETSLGKVFAEVAERGPISARELAEPGKRTGNWWGWSDGKNAIEYLFDGGLLAIAGRRGFERLYDLTERVIPRAVLDAPVLEPEDAMKQLICLGAKACGVGTARDVTGYLMTNGLRDRLPREPWWERPEGSPVQRAKPVAARLLRELVEEGRLLPASVEGWREPAYLDPGARIPRSVNARALVTPFDSLVWERDRIDRLFGMKYTIELYTPPPKRVYGYYVCPFLLGDTLVGRTDLKADRQRGVLMVQSAFLEPEHEAASVAEGLAGELALMRDWLGLERIEVKLRGDLAPMLRICIETNRESPHIERRVRR